MKQRTCPVCRETFTPANHNQRFCPPTSTTRATAKGQPRSQCARAYQRAKERGTLDQLLATPWSPPTPFNCARCGTPCVPGENVVAHASKFCGQECKRRWHHKKERGRNWPSCPARPQPIRAWIEGHCPECGERFIRRGRHKDAVGYCSRRCGRRVISRRRRAAKAGVGYKSLTFWTIAERDQWTCQLCGDAVDCELTVPHPLAPTLDHIIPLARGGGHTEANAQLAHFICNSKKSDGTAVETGRQMTLV